MVAATAAMLITAAAVLVDILALVGLARLETKA